MIRFQVFSHKINNSGVFVSTNYRAPATIFACRHTYRYSSNHPQAFGLRRGARTGKTCAKEAKNFRRQNHLGQND
jgi:hypothetical protein